MAETFSNRHGYRGPNAEIIIREDAPGALRSAILLIAEDAGMAPSVIRQVICRILLVQPDPGNWSAYPNVWNEVNYLIADCPWFKVYDIAEALHAELAYAPDRAQKKFADRLNQFFHEQGIGWELLDGCIVFRGSEAFAESTRDAVTALTETGRSTAASEIHEALQDISRRPPDITGAIQHVMAGLESAARDVVGQSNRTLGQLVPELDLPRPLDTAVEKLWGYASDRARHIREGQTVDTTEAELVVSVACAICTFLTRRSNRDNPESD